MGRTASLLHALALVAAAVLPSCGGCSGSELSGDAETRDTTTPDTAPPDSGPDPVADLDADEVEIPPGIYWARRYGTSEGSEQAEVVVETAGGGFIIAGYDKDYSFAIWLIGIDASGDIQWQKEYPLYGVDMSAGPTADGGIVLANDSWMARLDREGDVVWRRQYATGGISSILQASEGGFVAAGTRSVDPSGPTEIQVLRVDDAGEVVWQIAFASDGEYKGKDVAETTDGGFIVVGTQRLMSVNHDALAIKLDASGALSWRMSYGGEGNDDARAVHATDDGGAIVAGHRMVSSGASLSFWAMRIDADGVIVWQTELEGSYWDYLRGLDATDDGGCVLAGSRQGGYDPDISTIRTDAWAVKLDAAGDVAWQRSYGGSDDSQAMTVLQASDGGLVVAGCTAPFGMASREAWVLKTDSNGLISPSCESTIGAPTLAVTVETDFDAEVPPLSFHETDASSVLEDVDGIVTDASSVVQCSS